MNDPDRRTDPGRGEGEETQKIGFFINILNSLTHPFYVIDANDYSIILANSAAWQGLKTGTITCYALTHGRNTPCDNDKHPCVLKIIKETKQPVITEHVHLEKNGESRIYEVHGYPIFDRRGSVAQIVEYNLDITMRKKAEEKIRSSLSTKDVLLKEIHHRIKNNMSVISSLLNMQSEYIGDERYKEIFRESVERIKIMSLVHDKIYHSEDPAKIVFSEYIESLVDNLYMSYGLGARNITLIKNIDKITSLRIDEATSCGLIINELFANSVKHAFPGRRSGEIKIALRMKEQDEIELTVSDNGTGIPDDLDFRNTNSLGLTLVNALAGQLKGHIELNRRKGTEFRISFRMRE